MDAVIEILIEVFGEMFFECFSFDAIWLPKKPLSKRRQKIISVILLTITALAFFALVGALIFLIGTRGSSLLGWALLLFDLVYVIAFFLLKRKSRRILQEETQKERELIDLIKAINVESRDDGTQFTVTTRLDAIRAALKDTDYRPIFEKSRLFALYAKKPLKELPKDLVLISTHADAVPAITRFFTQENGDGTLRGTFDNSITNAIAVSAMQKGLLPDNVIVAFTADEEVKARGAILLSAGLLAAGKRFRAIVLDVTPMGYEEHYAFTVENNYNIGATEVRKIVRGARRAKAEWGITVVDPNEIPQGFPAQRIFRDEVGAPIPAMCDEARTYGRPLMSACTLAFSLCIPTEGQMHSNEGILVRRSALCRYRKALAEIAAELSR